MTATTSSRLTQRDYYAVAMTLLAEGSHDSLTTAALCDELGVSKGSFSHRAVAHRPNRQSRRRPGRCGSGNDGDGLVTTGDSRHD